MDGYTLSADPALLQFDVIHRMLSGSYWSPGIRRHLVELAFENSQSAGAYDSEGTQIGVARIVTDQATFAYLCDVYVEESHRGHGLGKSLVQFALDTHCPPHIRNLVLLTSDMQPLYRQLGFVGVEDGRCMQLKRPRANWT